MTNDPRHVSQVIRGVIEALAAAQKAAVRDLDKNPPQEGGHNPHPDLGADNNRHRNGVSRTHCNK
jgi:hypothetical protein